MRDLTGYMKMNSVDVWAQYHAFLCELAAGEHVNMDELRKMPKMKPYTAVSFRESDGEELPDVLSPRYEAIERTLQFCVIGSSYADHQIKYNDFMAALKSGWLLLGVKDVGMYKIYYQEQSNVTWYDDPIMPACVFKIKLREPKPGFTTE